jgi:acetoacetyl-CoA synthetase
MGGTGNGAQSNRVERSCGSPCPDRQEAVLRVEKMRLPHFNPLVLLKPGTDAPLFFVHGGAGGVQELFPLGKLVRSTRPIYAIQARGLDGADPPFDSLAQMASYYTDNIKDIQLRGPYLLAGYSFGGVVAFEMARQLRNAGEKVALLALLDSYTHPQHWPASCRVGVLCAKIKYRASLATRVPMRETINYYLRRLQDMTGASRRKYARGLAPMSIADKQLLAAVSRVRDGCYVAWNQYRPNFYPGKITFLKAGRDWRWPQDPGKIWRDLADEFEIHIVPGDHQEIVGLAAEHLARRISLCLEQTPGFDIAE